MHRLLLRQIKRFFGEVESLPAEVLPLVQAINTFYHQADEDHAMIERSLDIASQEMLEQNRALTNELEARRAAESQVARLANFDELTGLANRHLLNVRLNQAIALAQREGHKVGVMVLGLDHFKIVNDSLGSRVGDELLKIIGQRLGSCFRGSDVVARLGGAEFALVSVDSPEARTNFHRDPEAADTEFDTRLTEMLQRLLKTVSDTVVLAGQELQITCSIGLSRYPQDGDNGEVLLKMASAAMSSAKQLGRNNFQFYTPGLSARIETRLAMQGQLRLAIERGEFVLHYQPQVDLCSGCVIGMEALVRWNHPELGLVAPLRFIGLAEETGLIVPIGAWVIRTACEQCVRWQREGRGQIRMAVNVSVRQFAQPDLVECIAAVLSETGLEARWLEIELTESLVMSDVERSIDVLQRLKALGLQISIDDFGTGYSSLAYLKRFPIDLLKIDQAFVRDIDSSDDAAIVKAIISLAHDLGMRVIAEGAETEEQCDFLRLNMCDEMQGYFFSRPLDAEQIGELLGQDKRLPDRLLRFEKPKRTLLLVDDEPNITASLKRALRGKNLRILTANGGQEGLDILAQHPIDVIVSDQRMPGMTGVEFLKIAKDLYPETVRIMLSGFTELGSVIEAVNGGAVYKFLTKPWEDKQLRDSIEEAFQHREMADENRRLNLEVRTANLELTVANRKLEGLLKLKRHSREAGKEAHGSSPSSR